MSLEWVFVLALPPAITAAVIVMLARSRLADVLVDQPNERSLHEAPTPRLGGLGLMAGALPVAAWFGGDRHGVALACASALALLSAVDDWRSLPVQVRLPAHLVASIVAVLALAAPSAGAVAMDTWVAIAVVFALVWMSNLYNFMDGSDALAGLMALIGFGAYAVAATIAGSMSLAFVSAAIAAAAAGFLTFNFPPARVFLGDAGSVPLGFLAGALGMQGAVAGDWPWWFPILVFSPFIVDASVTILKRLIRGERIWIAHREHYYQRLVLQGWSPRRVALCAAMLMGAVAVSAIAALSASEMLQCGIITGWSMAFVLLLAAGEAMTRKNKNGNGARQSNRTSGGQQ